MSLRKGEMLAHSSLNAQLRALILYSLVLMTSLSLISSNSLALEKPGQELQEVGIEYHLGQSIDRELIFYDEEGSPGSFGELIGQGKPTILVPVYYECPRLCGLVLDGVVQLIREMSLTIGEEYKLVAVSFDPSESSASALRKASEYRSRVSTELNQDGWSFLTGPPESVNALLSALGFTVRKDGKDFAHTAMLAVLTPEAEIAQYFTGIRFSQWDVRMALIEASQGGIGSALDHVLLFCYRFDPTRGKYTFAALNTIRAGGLLTLVLLGGLLVRLYRKERSRTTEG